jgi:hypothetical protein
MLGKKCDPSVIAEIPVTRPVDSSELYKGQPLSPIKHPARYRSGSTEILGILVLRGRGHNEVLRAEEDNCQKGEREKRQWGHFVVFPPGMAFRGQEAVLRIEASIRVGYLPSKVVGR